MSVSISLSARPGSLQFSDRVLECSSSETLAIGRADTGNRADTDNAFFNCKVGWHHFV